MSGLFLHNEMHKECTNNFKWYPFDNCIGYCKRYCTLKYCVWFFCSNSMSCSYILCTSFCECRFVCHIHRAQKESIHLWMRVATNSIRQIQMHSLKDLVCTVTAYRNECYLKSEHWWLGMECIYCEWIKIDIDRIIFKHFLLLLISVFLHPQTLFNRENIQSVWVVSLAPEKEILEKKGSKKMDLWSCRFCCFDCDRTIPLFDVHRTIANDFSVA